MRNIQLNDEQVSALSDIINGTLHSLPVEAEDDFQFWCDTLRTLGCHDLANDWEEAE